MKTTKREQFYNNLIYQREVYQPTSFVLPVQRDGKCHKHRLYTKIDDATPAVQKWTQNMVIWRRWWRHLELVVIWRWSHGIEVPPVQPPDSIVIPAANHDVTPLFIASNNKLKPNITEKWTHVMNTCLQYFEFDKMVSLHLVELTL